MGGVNEELLKQLAPAHAPPPLGWWPPAPGWWGLAALLLLIATALFLWLRRPQRRLRLTALRELKQLERNADAAALAHGLQHLLRRYAVARYGNEPVAQLSGESWIDFVAAHGGADLAGEPGRALLRAAYGGAAPEQNRVAWLSASRGFLRGSKKTLINLPPSFRRKPESREFSAAPGPLDPGFRRGDDRSNLPK